jgi:DNA (cytosine-5)-methyltransferase 1
MYKTVDICAGIGGIRRGFELTGKTINVLSAENDKYACKTYQHLYNDNPMNDITTSEFKDLISGTDFDILLAGFPCQAFSAVGKKKVLKIN